MIKEKFGLVQALLGAFLWVFATIGFVFTNWLAIAYLKWEWHYLFINELGLTFGLTGQ